MTDIERQIAVFLHEEADRAALPEGMEQRVYQRAKIRRVLIATVAGVALLATVLTGAVVAGAFRSPVSVAPVTPGESPRPSVEGKISPPPESNSECAVKPRELPSGADSGASRSEEGDYGELQVWGKGIDGVWLLDDIPPELGLPDPSHLPAGDPQRVTIRGNEGLALTIGETAASQIILTWRAKDCGYVVWLGPGLDLESAIDYASRF